VETLLKLGIEVLRLVPLILIFYVPALLGVVIWKERGEGYRAKALLTFALGFGAIIAVQVLFRSVSAMQVAVTVGLSLVQISAALALAALTVYKLAD
jgi:tryptophan-rich sensory protein